MSTTDQPKPLILNPQERVAVLMHWLKGLGTVPGTALDGVEMAGRVASDDGAGQLAPGWTRAWIDADKPLYGLVVPRSKQDAAFDPDLASPEEDAFCKQMDALDDLFQRQGLISPEESDLLINNWWHLYHKDREGSAQVLEILNRVFSGPRPKKKV